MSHILILVGSCRKEGNTELLARAFEEGARQKHEVEVVSAADYKVNPCIGCNACFKKENNDCFQKDDMPIIYDKLAKADVLVIASPVYFYGLSAQLKAMIDRLHTPKKYKLKINQLALLLVAADTTPTVFDAIKLQYQLALDYFKLKDAGMVLVSGVEEKGAIAGNKGLWQAAMLGRSIK